MNRSSGRGETVVGEPGLGLVSIGLPLLCAGLGWLLQAAAGWLVSLPMVPMRGPLRLVDSVSGHEPAASLVSLGVGAAVGLLLALTAYEEHVAVAVSDRGLTVRRGGKGREFDRRAVRAVFLDDSYLVLLDEEGRELLRQSVDLKPERLGQALRAHGFPWTEDDPHRDTYQRWVADLPALSTSLDALFRARERALDRNDRPDAEQLREELARQGVVVRDEGTRQFWRLVAPPEPEPEG